MVWPRPIGIGLSAYAMGKIAQDEQMAFRCPWPRGLSPTGPAVQNTGVGPGVGPDGFDMAARSLAHCASCAVASRAPATMESTSSSKLFMTVRSPSVRDSRRPLEGNAWIRPISRQAKPRRAANDRMRQASSSKLDTVTASSCKLNLSLDILSTSLAMWVRANVRLAS